MNPAARLSAVTPANSSRFTPDDAHEMLRTKFAPWVHSLGLVVEECTPMGARLRLPNTPQVARFGNTLSGQAMMAAADSAMAIAIASAFGEFRNCTTVGQTTTFMRPIANTDALIEATVRKLGKSLAFGEVTFRTSESEAICAHATSTWALIA